jgi:small conductance mechanosensitive channel
MISMETLLPYIDSHAIPWGINFVLALIIFIVGRMAAKLIATLTGKLLLQMKVDSMLSSFAETIVKAVLTLLVVVAALNKLGVDTTSLIALLGAAGLAIGLSLQDSLKNFAAGVMILTFRPFSTGHFVEAAGVSGIVESIGIFSTVIRSGDNKEITVPNGAIYGDNIVNYSARQTRRVDLVFGISYDDDIKKAKQLIQQIVEGHELVLDDPAPLVAVYELADSSVNFVVRPWVKTADYWAVYYDITEAVKVEFDKASISIPYPQMDLHMKQSDNG